MEQTKTKKALIMSVLSVFLCIAMLIGMTFAWFTDTASTGVNTIQSGKLKVQLLDSNNNELSKEEPLGWVTQDEGDVLWEPNCTYNLDGFKVKNAGNLALKYKLVLKAQNITTNDGKSLLDVIDWTVKVGDDETITIASDQIKNGLEKGIAIVTDKLLEAGNDSGLIKVTGHMRSDAGNEYQNLKIDGFGITVYATQASYENDSYGPNYDASADYPEVQPVSSSKDLKDVLTSDDVNGKTIKLYDNIDTGADSLNLSDKDVALDLNGKTLTADNGLKVNDSTVVFKDTSESGNGQITVDNSARNGVLRAENSNVTIESGKFVSEYDKGTSGYARVISVTDSNLTINGGYFENSDAVGSYNYMIEVDDNKTEATTITINGGEFVSHRSYGYFVKGDGDLWNTKVVINGGTFKAEGSYSNLTNVKGTVEVNDCTYIAENNNNVFGLPKDYNGTNSPKVTVRGGSYTVTDNNLAGFVYCNKDLSNAYGYIPGTIILDPVKTLKINTKTHTTILSDCGVQQSAKDADGFYTISK